VAEELGWLQTVMHGESQGVAGGYRGTERIVGIKIPPNQKEPWKELDVPSKGSSSLICYPRVLQPLEITEGKHAAVRHVHGLLAACFARTLPLAESGRWLFSLPSRSTQLARSAAQRARALGAGGPSCRGLAAAPRTGAAVRARAHEAGKKAAAGEVEACMLRG